MLGSFAGILRSHHRLRLQLHPQDDSSGCLGKSEQPVLKSRLRASQMSYQTLADIFGHLLLQTTGLPRLDHRYCAANALV